MTTLTETVFWLVSDYNKVDKLVLLKCKQDIIKIYESNANKFQSLTDIVNDTLNSNRNAKEEIFTDFKGFLAYLLYDRPQCVGDFIANILTKPPYNNDTEFNQQLKNVIEESWLEVLETKEILKSGENHFTISTKGAKNHIIKIIKIPPTFSNKEVANLHQKIMKYKNICCSYVIYKESVSKDYLGRLRLKSSSNEKESSFVQCIFIIFTELHINMENWMTKSLEQRKLANNKEIKTQLQMGQVLISKLQTLLKSGLIHGSLLPHKFFLCKIHNYTLPYTFTVPSTKELLNTQNKDYTMSDNIRSVGMLILYSFSILEKFEDISELSEALFGKDQKSFDTVKSLSIILGNSFSLLNLVKTMINPDFKEQICVEEFCSLEIDWDEILIDFKNKVGKEQIKDRGTYVKLMCIPIATRVFQVMHKDISETAEKSFDFANEKENFTVPESISTLKDFIQWLQNDRPWLIAKLIYDLRSHFEQKAAKKLADLVDEMWMEQFNTVKFVGSGKYGYIFQQFCKPFPHSVQMFLLIPLNSRTNSLLITPKADLQKMAEYFMHIENYKIFSKEISNYSITAAKAGNSEESSNLLEMSITNRIVEIWLIQLPLLGPSLKNWLEDNRIVSSSFKKEMVESIIESVQGFMHANIPVDNVSTSYFFFQFDYDNDTDYKLPINFVDLTLVSPTNKCDNNAPQDIFSSLGIIILSVIFQNTKELDSFVNKIGEMSLQEFSAYFDIDNSLIELLYEMTYLDGEFTKEDFLAFKIKSTSPQVPETESHLLSRLSDPYMGKKVFDIMWLDILNSGVEKQFDFPYFYAALLDFCFLISEEKPDKTYDKLMKIKINSFEDLQTFVNDNPSCPIYQIFFKNFLYKSELFENVEFKKKLFNSIEKVSVSLMENLELIGQGAFGYVLKAENKIYGISYAVKIIIPRTVKETSYIEAEIENQKNLHHSNIVSVLNWLEGKLFTELELRKLLNFKIDFTPEMSESDVTSTKSRLEYDIERLILRSRKIPVKGWLMEMDLCGPTLKQWLIETLEMRQNPSINLGRMQLCIVRNLIRGLQYLQSKNIMHHDLKPDNILFSIDHSKEIENPLDYSFPIKIADLGLSRLISGGIDYVLVDSSQRGNERYQAPEIVNGKGYSLQAEIYSIGLIILEVFVPIANGSELETVNEAFSRFEKFDAGIKLKDCSDSLLTALCRMIKPKINERMSCDEFQTLDFDWIMLHANFSCQVQQTILNFLKTTIKK